jgi:type I restriction enzyme S subunit
MAELKQGWQRVRFGDVVRLNKETCKDPEAEGIERVIGLEHLEPGDLRVRSWADVADGTTFSNRVRPGQVLFGKRRAYQRKVAVADFDAICSGDIYVFETADHTQLLQELLPFLCQTDSFFEYAVGTSAGSLSPRTNWKSLAQYEFILPPLPEQRRLVQLLEALRLVANHYISAKAKLDLAISACVENSLFKLQSFFREEPAVNLLDRLTVGIVVKPSDWYTSDGSGIPALRSLNVRPGELHFDDLVRISLDGHVAHKKSQLLPGDVVVVRTGRPGEAAVVPEGAEPLNCIDLIVTTPGDKLNPHYFALFLNSATGRRSFSAGAAGTAQQHFNVGAFKRIRLPLPPLDIQIETANKIERLVSARSALTGRIARLKMLMQSTLQSGVIQ